jgi:3-oxocholest-4-en-26-oate---CoA ligase
MGRCAWSLRLGRTFGSAYGRTMSGWNFADIWERAADRLPNAVALTDIRGSRTWHETDAKADAIARVLVADKAVGPQSKVALYLYNCPEYVESLFAIFKAGLVPVNTNYRYADDELVYLWDNSDSVAVVFHGVFTDRIDAIRSRVPRVRLFLHVDDGTTPCPSWAMSYETAAAETAVAEPVGRFAPTWGRSGDDLLLLYTGGTTGMPKGVMWRQDDLFASLDGSSRTPLPADVDWDAFDARVSKPGPINLPAAPLMHGTGLFNAMSNLMIGGSVVTMAGRRFDPLELLETVQTYRVMSMSIVGDAFAKPILRTLDEHPGRFDISSLRVIVSSGVMWSAETKAGLLRHNPRLIMIDSLGSSEAISMASSVTTSEGADTTASFKLGPHTRVLTEDGREVQPGSGELGRVALRGRTPVGYYKDEAKSAATFQLVGGVRYSIPGDWAEVDADGSIKLLGRGSQCINTGGEKVYPEEVEEALKLHPSVADAAVVGVPDERFGQAICALVEPMPGASIDEATLIAHVKSHLSGFKAPKRVISIASVNRAANGKLDYKALLAEAGHLLSGLSG